MPASKQHKLSDILDHLALLHTADPPTQINEQAPVPLVAHPSSISDPIQIESYLNLLNLFW